MNTARRTAPEADAQLEGETLRKSVTVALEKYFSTLDGHECTDLFRMVLAEVEAPMLECVLLHAQGNQSKAADMLGITRRMLKYKMDKLGIPSRGQD